MQSPEATSQRFVLGPARVIGKYVNVRSEPRLQSNVLGRLTHGQEVTVLEEVVLNGCLLDEPSAWVKVVLLPFARAWVKSSHLDAMTKVVVSKQLNVRSGPGENYGILGVLERGEAVKEISAQGDWTEIEAPWISIAGQTNPHAFVAAKFLMQGSAVAGSVPARAAPRPALNIWFDHGLGDCVHMALLLQLYKRRGYEVGVHYEGNKEPCWKVAGIPFRELAGLPYHRWEYLADFNRPVCDHDGTGNKIWGNLNAPPLPDIGDRDALWDELSKIKLSGEILRDPKIEAETNRFLADLPRPIILLHTNGTNWSEGKSIPSETTEKLYPLLLDGMAGSLILLDWDNRVPRCAHGRVRHVRDDWGHIDLSRLWHLMCESDLLIGVDSGPYHFGAFADIATLGVFHGHYPASITIPRGMAANMTRGAYRQVNTSKRARWNIIEYGGDMPLAEEIARHALRMLDASQAGPRYFRSRDMIGRDVMMQQWIRDWCRASTNLASIADRNKTMDWLFQVIKRRYPQPTIVETGCIRSSEDWPAGYATYLFSALVDGLSSGQFTTVDNSADNLATARQLTAPFASRSNFVLSDSATWLQATRTPIDVLYLDSWDADVPGHAEHGLAEIQAAAHALHERSIVIYDDTIYLKGWQGKGALGIPWMLDNGWRVIQAGYQAVLVRKDSPDAD